MSLSLGCRALALSIAELDAGVREEPMGSNDGPRIRLYRAHPMMPQSLPPPGPWCAYAASWTGWQAALLLVGSPLPPHYRRASVHELVDDARRAGAWHPAGDGYVPQPGDLAVFGRDGQDPTRGGAGHVGRVEQFVNSELTTIDGNHGDRWARVTRPLAKCLGFIAYPLTPETPTDG